MNKKPTREVTAKSVGASIAATLGNFAGPNAMVTPTIGLFAVALTTEFGWSRTAFYSVNVVVAWCAALVAPLTGMAIDRFGARRVLLPAVVFFALAYVGVSRANGSLPQFFLLFGLVGVGAGLQSHVGYKKVVAQWFSRHRGLALTLVSAVGVGLGTTLMPQVTRLLIEQAGWRNAYLGIAAIIICVGLPIPFFLLREPKPEEKASGDTAPVKIRAGMSRAEAMRTRTFWLMAGAVMLTSVALIGTSTHTFPMLTDRGVSSALATTVLSVTAIGSIVGQLSSGLMLDRIDSPRMAAPFFGLALIGGMMLHFASAPPMFVLGGFLMGMTKGAELGLIGYFCTRYFGVRAFGAIYGLLYGSSVLAAGIGPLLAAASHDRLGSYVPVFILFDVCLALSLVGMALLRPYTFTKAGDPLQVAAAAPPPPG